MCKLISSGKYSDDSSVGFHRSIEAREKVLTTKKQIKGHYHNTIYLKGDFGFAEDHHNCFYGLGYKLTSQENSDKHVSRQLAGLDVKNRSSAGRVFINELIWYIPQYEPSVSNQKIIVEHVISKMQKNYHILNDHLIWRMWLLKKFGALS